MRDVDDSEEEVPQVEGGEEDSQDDDDVDLSEDELDAKPSVKAYQQLIQSFTQPVDDGERRAKRRKIEEVVEEDAEGVDEDVEMPNDDAEDQSEDEEDVEEEALEENAEDSDEDEDNRDDPYEAHFATEEDDLSRRLKALQSGEWKTSRRSLGRATTITTTAASDVSPIKSITTANQLPLKDRLSKSSSLKLPLKTDLDQTLTSHVFTYTDLLISNRTSSLFNTLALHATNHILKGRDKVLKNNARLRQNPDSGLELRDQGFVRPKVLILLETRQAAYAYASSIVKTFAPDQQENRKRFDDAFFAPVDENSTMPEDYQQLFGGNNDNSFVTALKFTRKTLKFYSAFYNSDIILASPLGLRRIIENEDVKKRDYDFLSSIEVVIADQLEASYMQAWENVSVVFSHLNLELKETHGCDFSRVRNAYLDGKTKNLRQTILVTGYVTPEMQKLYNGLANVAGKAKVTPIYPGNPLAMVSGMEIKQTFSRFVSASPMSEPDERFKFFTTAVLPALLRAPKPMDGVPGIMVFIPSYFDFLRLRNFFATSTLTENISFGTIHDYSEVSEQRRARSHFNSGRHTVLLYTQRAHHFYRLRLKGVKRVVCYGVPDNPIFYEEVVGGFLGNTIEEGKTSAGEASVRNLFCKWDGLRVERVVGSERVGGLLSGVGDTFDFV